MASDLSLSSRPSSRTRLSNNHNLPATFVNTSVEDRSTVSALTGIASPPLMNRVQFPHGSSPQLNNIEDDIDAVIDSFIACDINGRDGGDNDEEGDEMIIHLSGASKIG